MPPPKPPDRTLIFVNATVKKLLMELPDEVRQEVGHALYLAQLGRKPPQAKPLSGEPAFKGSSVLEIVEDDDGNTYRAVYTVRYPEAVYVLHVFQKKSTKGIATPRREIDTIKLRLAEAERQHAEKFGKQDSA